MSSAPPPEPGAGSDKMAVATVEPAAQSAFERLPEEIIQQCVPYNRLPRRLRIP